MKCLRISIAVLTALGACAGEETHETTARRLGSPADVRLSYCWNVRAHDEGFGDCTNTSPAAAYQAGDAKRRQLCGNDQTCNDEGVVWLQPCVWLDSNPVATLTRNGFDATFTRYVEGVGLIRSFFEAQGASVRATDYARSLSSISNEMKMLSDFAAEPNELRDDALGRVNDAPTRVADLGAVVKGAEAAHLAKNRVLLARARAEIDRYHAAVHADRGTYAAIAAEYRAFRDTEAVTTATLRSIVERGSAAALGELPGIQLEVISVVRQENDAPMDLIVRVRRLNASLEARHRAFMTAIAPHVDFLTAQDIPVPDLTKEPTKALTGMLGYLEDRLQRTNLQVSSLLSDLIRRKSALILAARDQMVRDGVATSSRARAAADFLASATQAIDAVWAAQPTVAGVELLEERWKGIVALLQTAELCTGVDTPPWMASGCDAYRRAYSKARLYRDNSLARTIRRDATRLGARGADTPSLAALEAAVAAGDFATAAHLHDAIARGLEGTP